MPLEYLLGYNPEVSLTGDIARRDPPPDTPIPMISPSLLLAVVFALAVVIPTAAQTPRHLDNFDLSSGVSFEVRQSPQVTTRPVASGTGTKGKSRLKHGAGEVAPYTVSTASVRMVSGSNLTLRSFTTGNPTVDSYIVESSRRYNIDPLLIYAQMHQESSFKQRAVSHKGASGLMQLMPATARRFGVTNIFDPRQNIDAGVKYMRWLLDTFGQNLELALAGYNAGEGAVMKYGRKVPPFRETREYVRRITARYASISDARFINTLPTVSSDQASLYEGRESRPLTMFETRTTAIRLPDGTMKLVNN